MNACDLTARAFEIADECMVAMIECHAVPVGSGESPLFGLSNENGNEVACLAEAEPAIIEAFEWLKARGLAELVEDEHGECILLKVNDEA